MEVLDAQTILSGEEEDCNENEDVSQSLIRSTRTGRTLFANSTSRRILVLLAVCASASSKTLGQAAPDLNSWPKAGEDIMGVILAKKEDPHEQHRKEDLIGREIQPRVVGGSDVARGAYPYFVRIDVNYYPHCGGSLVAPDVVLTAGHCQEEQMSVIVNGYHDSHEVNDDQRFRSVEYTLRHPEYEDTTYQNDLMLLKLVRPVNIIPYVKLNRDIEKPAVRETVLVMGLGAIVEGGDGPDLLQAAEVEVMDHTKCSRAYERTLGMVIKEDIMLCAGSRTGATDSCQGDSGGPLIDSRGYQVGLVSFGLGCARLDYPGVYARTMVGNGVYDWLGETICNMTTADDIPEWCSSPPSPLPRPEPIPAPPRPTAQPKTALPLQQALQQAKPTPETTTITETLSIDHSLSLLNSTATQVSFVTPGSNNGKKKGQEEEPSIQITSVAEDANNTSENNKKGV